MREISQLTITLKRQLKLQGRTYRDLADELELSEQSIKRMFATENFDADRLVAICNYLGFTLAEMAQEAVAREMHIHTLKESQEKELVADGKLLLVAVCALNHWTLDDIVATYRISEIECLKRLLRLDKLDLIALLPGNRIRLNVSRDFDWITDGPIKQYFNKIALSDFLNSAFSDADEAQTFSHGMLTEAAIAKMQTELRMLRKKFAEFHEESLKAPLSKRRGCGMLLAMREWEPAEFEKYRIKR